MILKIVAFVLPLGFDTFAVAVALGLRGLRPLRPALTFAFFEAVMPLAGLFLGYVVGARFETPAVVMGGVVLLAIAGFILKEAREPEDEAKRLSFSSLKTAALAGFGISMDELAIGFPMGATALPVGPTIGAIALQALVVTYLGIAIGNRLSEAVGSRTSRFAAYVAAAAFAVLGAYLVAQRFVPALPEI